MKTTERTSHIILSSIILLTSSLLQYLTQQSFLSIIIHTATLLTIISLAYVFIWIIATYNPHTAYDELKSTFKSPNIYAILICCLSVQIFI